MTELVSLPPRKKLPKLCAEAWLHPQDESAFNALQRVAGLDASLRFFLGKTTEKSLYLSHLANAVKCTDRQFPEVYHAAQAIAETLDSAYVPDVFVVPAPLLAYGALGVRQPFIVLSPEEAAYPENLLTARLGQEFGNVLSGRVFYKTLMEVILKASQYLMNIPLTGVAVAGILAGLKNWHDKSQRSADRAALLAVQNPDVLMQLLAQQAGGAGADATALGAFLAQADAYEAEQGLKNSGFKLLSLLGSHQPSPVLRIKALIAWVQSGAYDSILRGDYPKGEYIIYAPPKVKTEKNTSEENNFRQQASQQAEDAFRKARDMFNPFFGKEG
jgi:Zn-dependent protease with chaperone function